ncbi:MAG TPA: hypothetical protein PKJ08_07090 [Candidatus Cloacimonadota bacterium]|jgi:hypothetical protein|nr:hypothetical protein [Candidatus Cloacimonadota bacterium]HPM02871.1 hypothetical protein [Candidatus Cloacimonadota bacterium]
MKGLIYLFIVVMLTLSACSTDLSEDDIDRSKINDILLRVRDEFNDVDIDKVMSYYDTDYYHNGLNLFNQTNVWYDRSIEYNYLELSEINIVLNGDFAVVHFIAKYSKQGTQTILIEPDEIGDMSYFRKVNGEWKIYGNQND